MYRVAARHRLVLIGCVTLGVFACGSPSSEPRTPSARHFAIVVENDRLVTGPREMRVREGDSVTIALQSRTPKEETFLVHGYELRGELDAGEPATLRFVADRPGRFDYEIEEANVRLGTLIVLRR